jgi:hypothetical protein
VGSENGLQVDLGSSEDRDGEKEYGNDGELHIGMSKCGCGRRCEERLGMVDA